MSVVEEMRRHALSQVAQSVLHFAFCGPAVAVQSQAGRRSWSRCSVG